MNYFFKEAVGKHHGHEIVVVSHGDPIMISMIKHQGKRLTLSAIRGEEYVQTAKGYSLTYDEFSPIRVDKLDF